MRLLNDDSYLAGQNRVATEDGVAAMGRPTVVHDIYVQWEG